MKPTTVFAFADGPREAPRDSPCVNSSPAHAGYRAVARATAKHRKASNKADGPTKNRSPGVGEAKLASALSTIPTTSTHVPHRKIAAGNREPQYPGRPRKIKAARGSVRGRLPQAH